VAQQAVQQRAPRKVDGERRGQAVKRLGRVLGRRHHEQRVPQPVAARRTARGAGHRGGVRVDADHERVGLLGGRGEHGPAVAGAEVDRYAAVPAGEVYDLADVDLVEGAASNDAEHSPSLSGPAVPQLRQRC
jgi:hypothetical protein